MWLEIFKRAFTHFGNLMNKDMRKEGPGGEAGSWITGGANITYGTSPQWKAQYKPNTLQKAAPYVNMIPSMGGGGGGFGGGAGGGLGGGGGGFGMGGM